MLGENIKFERHTGFYGSALRKWLDKNLPLCPLCKKKPEWEYARKVMGWKALFSPSATRYFLRCQQCKAILSVAQDAIVDADDLLVFLVQKRMNKNFKIESIGNNENLRQLVGQEHSLETLQEWASVP